MTVTERQQKICEYYTAGMHANEIAARLNCGISTVYSWVKRSGLPLRGQEPRRSKDDEESPSQEEIQARAAEVRSRWSEVEAERRIVGKCRASRWTPPAYTREQLMPQ
jgi:transposase